MYLLLCVNNFCKVTWKITQIMDQKPKSCERSSSTAIHFLGPLEGGIWSRFIFYHFDFTPWPAYCLSVLTVAWIRVLARMQVPPAHKLREVIFAPFSTRKKSLMEKLRSDLESLNTRVFKLQGAFFNFSPLNLAKSQSLYKIPYFNFFLQFYY